ncbi:2,3,4,5-tetrahydropyridine-2,6-dicarboxylate N-acetyltransferase [Chitinispirillum alkaliphilum]|nr:2,3,4,5-tetrahydropyridine-2,6-dicarboxylate N-acetyltransferase [Chitinispirillum alkaliphilum]
MIDKSVYIHSSACVDEPCTIGDNTKIYHFTHIMGGAEIGRNCILGQNVFIGAGVKIGNNVKIQNNVSLYAGTVAEDDVFLGPSCVFTNVINPRSQIDRRSCFEETLIRRGATIGANATVLCSRTIGQYSFIGAGTVVTKDVPDYGLVTGNPAVHRGWMSRHGYRLTEPDEEGMMMCPVSKLRYRFSSGDTIRCIDLGEEEKLPKEMRECNLQNR